MPELQRKKALLSIDIAESCRIVSAVWPLETFIAVNHLSGLEEFDFDHAMQIMSRLLMANGYLDLTQYSTMQNHGRITGQDIERAIEERKVRSEKRKRIGNDLIKSPFLAGDKNRTANSPDALCYSTMSDHVHSLSKTNPLENINKEVVKWCSLYFDRGQATWQMPHRELGLFRSWKKLVVFESMLPSRRHNWVGKAKFLPDDSLEAILSILAEIGVDDCNRVNYLARHLAQMPGWASYARWVQENGQEEIDQHKIADYLALRLFYELEFCRSVLKKELRLEPCWPKLRDLVNEKHFALLKEGNADQSPPSSLIEVAVWQEAYEINYRDGLLSKIASKLSVNSHSNEAKTEPEVQMVFCIDTRSEGIRRGIEAITNYQTIGFAGFFGFPVSYSAIDSDAIRNLCPVLLKPKYEVSERATPKSDRSLFDWLSARLANTMFNSILHFLKSNLWTKFYFVEAAGIWCIPLALLRNFFPQIFQAFSGNIFSKPQPKLAFSFDLSPEDKLGLPLQARLYYAEASLRTMGLTKYFSPLVILTGHASLSTNNPYASSLDCGACGGNTGTLSARLAATIFNQKPIREGLRERGIDIPDTTDFIAAEHNTTTDEIKLYEVEKVSSTNRELLAELKENLVRAGKSLQKERLEQFHADDNQSPIYRSLDWSQTRPEWGLARNAAFIAAKRELTSGLNLERRVFLHDYNDEDDTTGKILELILTAPLVVAQWINMQYYLSSVDNETFGAGPKVIHNVVANLGVMQGAASDLKIGLPWESLAANSDTLVHEPMRLLSIIEASREKIDAILDSNTQIKNLVFNRWIRLISLENKRFYESVGHKSWLEIDHNQKEQITSLQLAS